MPVLVTEGGGETLNIRVKPPGAGARKGAHTPRLPAYPMNSLIFRHSSISGVSLPGRAFPGYWFLEVGILPTTSNLIIGTGCGFSRRSGASIVGVPPRDRRHFPPVAFWMWSRKGSSFDGAGGRAFIADTPGVRRYFRTVFLEMAKSARSPGWSVAARATPRVASRQSLPARGTPQSEMPQGGRQAGGWVNSIGTTGSV